MDRDQDYVEITYGDSVTFSGTFTRMVNLSLIRKLLLIMGFFAQVLFTDENGHFEYTLTNERISYYRLLGYVSDVFIFSYDGIIAAQM